MESWEETTYASPLYNEMLAFRSMAQNCGRERLLFEIYARIEKYIEEGDFNLAMLFMNELELLFGIKNTRYAEYEHVLAPVYRAEMLKEKRPECFLINPNVPASQTPVEEFKNRHKGQRCFILGNGPSLNKVDLRLLKNEITFGVNSIFLNFGKLGFPVSYYAVEDTHVIRERAKNIGMLEKCVRFIPHYAARQIPWSPMNTYLNLVCDYTRYRGFPYFSTDMARRAWVGGTVTYICMQLAWYMGFDEVYLLGFDHSYVIPKSAEVAGNNIKSNEDDPNHFHPDYFGKGFHWHIPLTERMELCYRKTEYAFAVNGRKVFNATPGGKLEVFERRKYEDLLPGKIHPSAQTELPAPDNASPDISIIISAYNRAELLPRCIESALHQYGIQPEVIVIDDASTDNTTEICQEYARNYKNFKFLRQKNKGCGGARNTGMKLASAPYITFLDSDDSLDPDFLYRAIAIMDETGAEILDFDFKEFVGPRNVKKPKEEYMLETGLGALINFSFRNTLSATERIYRREFLEKNCIYFLENCVHEDLLFSVQTHFYASRKAFLPVMGYNCFRTGSSITSRITDRNLESLELQLKAIKRFFIENGIYERLHRVYYNLCYRLVEDVLLRRIQEDSDSLYRKEMLRKVRALMRKLHLLDIEIINLAAPFSKGMVDRVFKAIFPNSNVKPKQTGADMFNRLVFGSKTKQLS